MTDFEADQGFIYDGDTCVELDLEAFPGLYSRIRQKVTELNRNAATSKKEGGPAPVFTLQDAAYIVIQESFRQMEQPAASVA